MNTAIGLMILALLFGVFLLLAAILAILVWREWKNYQREKRVKTLIMGYLSSIALAASFFMGAAMNNRSHQRAKEWDDHIAPEEEAAAV